MTSKPFEDVVIRFPFLPDNLSSPSNRTHLPRMKKRDHPQVVPSKEPNAITQQVRSTWELSISMPESNTSAPISLPKTHIKRTPSELQLEALTLRAEDEDTRMYSRLFCGMRDQIRRRCITSDEDVHPLSRKSLSGVISTKLAKDQELESRTSREDTSSDDDDYFGWNLFDDDATFSFASLPEAPLLHQGLSGSKPTIIEDTEEVNQLDEGDDFVFEMDI